MMSKIDSNTLSVGSSLNDQVSLLRAQVVLSFLATFLVICLAFFTSSALAGEGELERSLMKCASISDNEHRLGCVDQVIQSITRPALAGSVQTTNDNASLGQKYLPKPKATQSNKAYHYSLIAVERDKKKRWVFSFENGQIWRQVEPRFFSKPRSIPARVDISTGVFGSFNLRVEGRDGTVKVKRLR